jgi:hypothetical protein
VPDLDYYSELLSALHPIEPIAITRVHRAATGRGPWQVTVPGERVTEHLAVTPLECVSAADATLPAREISLTSTCTRGWVVTHVPTGSGVVTIGFLPWARDCARRLSEVAGVDWSIARLPQRMPAEVADICEDYHRRLEALNRLAWSPAVGNRRDARRQLRRLGARFCRLPRAERGTYSG